MFKCFLVVSVLLALTLFAVQTIYLSKVSLGLLDSEFQFALQSSVSKPLQSEDQHSNHIGNNNQEGFAGCLLFKDDNHYLIEWLAYHYYRLPLKRLIIAVDPTSLTSPTVILDRYRKRNLMNITEWNDEDFVPKAIWETWKKRLQVGHKGGMAMTHLHRHRQAYFYLHCITTLKQEHRTWTSFVDVDEYIVPNRNVTERFRIPGSEDHTTTILELIESANRLNISEMLSSPCVQMKRLGYGSKESDPSQVQRMAPQGFNVSNLVTFRWRWHESYSSTRLGKCLLDVSRVSAKLHLTPSEINIHRIVRSLCPRENMYISHQDSSFVVNHYTGSWEQWSFRNDPRSKGEGLRTKEIFEKMHVDFGQDDSAREWLLGFFQKAGGDLASALLEDAGIVKNATGWTP